MPTLHIEHEINDFDVWTAAFAQFAEVRRRSGVRGQSVRRPVDDPHYVVIDLEFATVAEAESFRDFLRTKVWASPESSPALVGLPQTQVFEEVDLAAV